MSPVGSYSAASTSGCQKTLPDFVNKVRVALEDFDYEDRLQTAVNDSAVSLPVLDYTSFRAGDVIQLDSEMMYVSAAAANPITVRRGWRGTTAASHGANTTILCQTNWTDNQIKDWVNESFRVMYPKIRDIKTTTVTGSNTDYTYTLPADLTDASMIERIEATYGSTPDRWQVKGATVRNTNPPTLYLPAALSSYTLTVFYSIPFPKLDTDEEKSTLPVDAEDLPVYYACARAMEQKEAKRSRYDAYTPKQDELAIREGQQLQTGAYYWKRFDEMLFRVKMPSRGWIGNT